MKAEDITLLDLLKIKKECCEQLGKCESCKHYRTDPVKVKSTRKYTCAYRDIYNLAPYYWILPIPLKKEVNNEE